MYQARYASVIVLWWLVITDGNIVRNEDICGPHNGRRLYLELGEKGILYAKNVSFVKNAPRQDTSRIYLFNSSHAQCSLELVTCPSCVIIVTFKNLALSHHCGDGGVMMDSPCRCDYVWISEPPYEDVSGTPFCGLYFPITYRSSTRTLSIALLYSQSHKHAFTLEYTAERNRLHFKGTEITKGLGKGLNSTSGGILTSPFFPARYPRDLGLEYIITCPEEAPSCRIRLLFSDFQLATVSIMEFYDWNSQRLDVSSGVRFRPPVIVSSGPSLLIRFYANGGTGLGYKAFYSFVVGHLYNKSIQPITDCGGYVENLGGAITMMDMVGQGVKTYDCVWLIRPPKNFVHMKTHMYLKVVTFADMAGNTELTIKQGPTSALLPLEVLRYPVSQLQPPRQKEHIEPVTSGFHVSLRGTFGPSSHLAIAYAAFSYMDCFTGSDFLCQNHRCIPSQLNCDGFDHCGDNSDEPVTCFHWDVEPHDRKWHTNKANYYFPKIDRYPDLKTATLVFVASSLGLIILISALIVLLYRVGARARQQRELQSRLQTISELLVFDITDGARIDEIAVADDPPVYEAPPGYDEVVKVNVAYGDRGHKKRRNVNRNRNSPSSCSYEQESQSCSLQHQQPQAIIMEDAGGSCASQSLPIAMANVKGQCIPESPPPPYVTPPGSISKNLAHPMSSCEAGHAPCYIGKFENAVNVASSEEAVHTWYHAPRDRGPWYRRSCDFSRPLSASEEAHAAPLPSSSLDAEVLGAYLLDHIASYPSCTTEHSVPQSNNFPNVSTATNEQNQVEEESESVGKDTERLSSAFNSSDCTCEGACGCVNDRYLELEYTMKDATIREQHCPMEMEVSTSNDGESNAQNVEKVYSSKNAFARFLRSTSKQSVSPVRTSTTSSPSNLTTSFTKVSTTSSCGSYEKLCNVSEVASEAFNAGTSPKRTLRQRKVRRYSSCDLDSLYEGIKLLDSYLARRGKATQGRKQSTVAVMLFGTPEHSGKRIRGISRSAEGTVCIRPRSNPRMWHSNDDTLSN